MATQNEEFADYNEMVNRYIENERATKHNEIIIMKKWQAFNDWINGYTNKKKK